MSRKLQLARYGPLLLWLAYGANIVWAVLVRLTLSHVWQGAPETILLRPFAFGAGLVVANVIALILAVKICRDYAGEALRRAWLLVAWGAGFAALRYVLVGVSVWKAPGGQIAVGPLAGAAQVANIVGLVLLLAGLLRMRSGFATLGLGRLKRVDWVLIAAVAVITLVSILLLFQTGQTSPPGLRIPLMRGLRLLDPVLVGVFSIAAVILNRTSRDMQGGPLAISLRYVVLFVAVRLLAQIVPMLPLHGLQGIQMPFIAASLASDWLFTLVVFHRWSLTVRAEELAERY